MSARSATKRHPPSTPSRETTGSRITLAGVVVAAFGTAVAMLPGGYNPFGPAKALVLLGASTLVAAGLAISPALAVRAAKRIEFARGAWAALALLGVAALASAMSIAPLQSLTGLYPEYQGLLLLLSSGIAGFGAFAVAEEDGAWRLIGRGAVVALLAVAAYALLQFAGVDPVSYQREFVLRRVRSTLGNASNLGVFVCLALPLAIAHARGSERGAWRMLARVSVAAGALVLALSLSRGAWVGALAGTIAWLLAEGRAWDRARRVRVAAAVVGLAVAAGVVLALAVPSAGARLGSLTSGGGATATWRLAVWGQSARMIAERPVLGFGPATFRYAFSPRRSAATMVGETGVQALDDPHNLLISAAASSGIAGLLALLWLLAEGLLAGWGLRDREHWPLASPALLASLIAGLVALQFHFATVDSAPLLAVVLALAIGREMAARPESAAQPQAETPSLPGIEPSPRPLVLARSLAGAFAIVLAGLAVSACALVIADRNLASGFTLTAEKAAWPTVRGPFTAAERAAPWEPAMAWALGRAATQWTSATGLPDAYANGEASFEAARSRLPLDPLLAEQTAELHLVYGLVAKDRATLEKALSPAERACALDPENGYFWDTRGSALAALGRTDEAIDALSRAVRFSPANSRARRTLARMYERPRSERQP